MREDNLVFKRNWWSYLCQLSLCLPGSRQRVAVSTMKLAGNIARDANTGGISAGV